MLSYPSLECHTRASGYPLFLPSHPFLWFPAFAGKTSCICHTRTSGYPLFLKSYPLFWFPAFAGKTSYVLSYPRKRVSTLLLLAHPLFSGFPLPRERHHAFVIPATLLSYPRKRVSIIPQIISPFLVSRFRGKDIVRCHTRVSGYPFFLLSHPLFWFPAFAGKTSFKVSTLLLVTSSYWFPAFAGKTPFKVSTILITPPNQYIHNPLRCLTIPKLWYTAFLILP